MEKWAWATYNYMLFSRSNISGRMFMTSRSHTGFWWFNHQVGIFWVQLGQDIERRIRAMPGNNLCLILRTSFLTWFLGFSWQFPFFCCFCCFFSRCSSQLPARRCGLQQQCSSVGAKLSGPWTKRWEAQRCDQGCDISQAIYSMFNQFNQLWTKIKMTRWPVLLANADSFAKLRPVSLMARWCVWNALVSTEVSVSEAQIGHPTGRFSQREVLGTHTRHAHCIDFVVHCGTFWWFDGWILMEILSEPRCASPLSDPFKWIPGQRSRSLPWTDGGAGLGCLESGQTLVELFDGLMFHHKNGIHNRSENWHVLQGMKPIPWFSNIICWWHWDDHNTEPGEIWREPEAGGVFWGWEHSAESCGGKSIAVFSATSNTQSLLCIYGGGFQRLLMFQPPNGMRNSKVVAVHVAESPG